MLCIVGIFKFYMISYIKKKQSRENEDNNSLKERLGIVKRGTVLGMAHAMCRAKA